MSTAIPSLPLPSEIAFPVNALAFETADVHEVGPHFANINASPAQFCVESAKSFLGFRHSSTPLGRSVIDSFQLLCDGPQEVSSMRPLESEFFLFLPLRGGLEIGQGRRSIDVSPGQIVYQGNVIDLSQEEGSVESQFDSKWSFPEEEMKELFNGLPNKDEIYMRCLSVEYGCRYVEYHECEGKEGWYLS